LGCVGMVELLILLVLVDIALSSALLGWLYREKLDLEEIHERFDDLSNSLNVVAEVLTRLPELVPQFSINQSPLQPLIDMLTSRMKEQWGSNPEGLLRDDEGRFDDGAQEAEAEQPT